MALGKLPLSSITEDELIVFRHFFISDPGHEGVRVDLEVRKDTSSQTGTITPSSPGVPPSETQKPAPVITPSPGQATPLHVQEIDAVYGMYQDAAVSAPISSAYADSEY